MMPKVTRTRLTPSEYDEVSFVDAGANQDAHILIFKATSLPDGMAAPKSKNHASQKKVMSNGKQVSSRAQGSKGKTQRARNWNEANHKRNPQGDPHGGEFSSADGGKNSKPRTKSGKLKGAVRVKSGDTLWALAEKYLGDGRRWKEIARLNGIKDPRKLPTYEQSGKELKIPGGTFSHPGSWNGEKPRKNTRRQQGAVNRARARRKTSTKPKPRVVRKPVVGTAVSVRRPSKSTGYRARPV